MRNFPLNFPNRATWRCNGVVPGNAKFRFYTTRLSAVRSITVRPCQDRNIDSALAVVLVSTRNPLNIGAAARAVANFGLSDFRLVDPYDVAFREAVSAVGGAHVLQAARVFPNLAEAVADCSLVVGTTAAQRRVPQQSVEVLASGMTRVKAHPGKVALLFGSEKFGLSNEDMSFCHELIWIPTSPETPSMNLGQAVAVCLYELVRDAAESDRPACDSRPPGFEAVAGSDAEQLTTMLHAVLNESGYTNRITAVSTEQKIRRWIRRMRIGRRDAPLLLGILRQILWKFDHR
jgi:TrmH family RNA methyltransferase